MAFEKLYTAEEVAQITGLTLRTIRNYIKNGRLKGHRVGVQWRFTEADIQALFAGSSPTSDTSITTSAPASQAPVMDAAAIAAISAAASAMVNASVAAGAPGAVGVPGGVPALSGVAQTEVAAAVEEELSENEDQIRRFVQRKNPPRTCACCIVDKPGMTKQEAQFLFNRLQTLANVYANTPKRLEVTYEYDENRDQARFVFSGAMEAACAMMNLCDVQ